jgi:hypothetical protein
MKVLVVPDAALRDPESIEMLRVWIAEKSLWCSIRTGIYQKRKYVSEEKAWGVILADAARHIADALPADCGMKAPETIQRIKESFIAELAKPTSDTEGQFVQDSN